MFSLCLWCCSKISWVFVRGMFSYSSPLRAWKSGASYCTPFNEQNYFLTHKYQTCVKNMPKTDTISYLWCSINDKENVLKHGFFENVSMLIYVFSLSLMMHQKKLSIWPSHVSSGKYIIGTYKCGAPRCTTFNEQNHSNTCKY